MLRLAFLLLLLAAPLRAETLPLVNPAAEALLDTAAVPGLGRNGQAELARTLLRNLPRAFAIGPGGAYASRAGNAAPAVVAQAALEACQAHTPGRSPCQLWLRDLEIVFPGREWAPAPPPADAGWREPLRETVPDPRFLWWGPGRARGVVLWAHGRGPSGEDSRGRQPQAWLRHLNHAGFDIWRFDREPEADTVRRAAGWMRADLAALRAQGYRRVVAAGQSRGGWNALQALDTPGLAEVTIAIAPAALASMDEAGQARQMAALRAVLAGAVPGQARVAVANFRDDPFDGLPEERAAALRALAPALRAFLLIDRPEGLAGHAAGASTAFAQRYGPCLLRFVVEDSPPSSC
ncbi:alpha/beta fold hydrolase [Falsiroseomonas ponticola]|uniref:alpha/beta hydrolase n=1 Tax=Falsiroseomonas ponticola TaxID=2786951 RepID=UPI0019322131|nr:alpha/beta hydrolase [Roseomonas ponticola]